MSEGSGGRCNIPWVKRFATPGRSTRILHLYPLKGPYFNSPCSFRATDNVRYLRILLKNSEIEPLRKSRFRARRVTSADRPYGRAYRRVAGGKTGQSAEPLRNFASKPPAVFRIVIEAEIRVYGMARPSFRRPMLAGVSGGGRAMAKISVLGVDLGKNVCSVVGLDASGAVVMRRRIETRHVDRSGGEAACLRCRDGGVLRLPSCWPCLRQPRPRRPVDVS